jgi:DNA-binding beta-propeller fold protein YncE
MNLGWRLHASSRRLSHAKIFGIIQGRCRGDQRIRLVSPTGEIAVALLIRGSNSDKTSWFYNRNGSVVVLKIDGKKVTKVGEVEVGGLPEGAVFSPDGKYLYIGIQ